MSGQVEGEELAGEAWERAASRETAPGLSEGRGRRWGGTPTTQETHVPLEVTKG